MAGATGVLGSRIAALLRDAGHAVAGMTRSAAGTARLRQLSVETVVCDVYDRDALTAAVTAFAPELVIHQLTDLPDTLAELTSGGAANSRMRREGTANLIAAARAAGATRLLAQSIAWEPPGDGAVAKRELEQAVRAFGGVVVRYGRLYGPGTWYEDGAALPEPPRVHVDDAARRTIELIDRAGTVVTVADGYH